MDIKEKQAAYHDWEARNYDRKFSISYDQRCIDYAADRMRKVLADGWRFERTLEVGAGTGFFLVNLWQAGYLGDDAHATDISEGMLAVCKRNAAEHGLDVETRVGDAESLPYAEGEFDLVIGHAFLHHLPDPGTALGEMHRVLRPGGHLVVAGEPTLWGDRAATVVKRATYQAFRVATAVPVLRGLRRPAADGDAGEDAALAALEHEVDLHTFRPDDVARMAHEAGFDDVEVVTEELLSNWMGWAVRTIEGSVRPGLLGMRWAQFGYRTYLALNALDERVLRRVLPREVFYNLILHGVKPRG